MARVQGDILIKPMVTEKSTITTDRVGQYTFEVDRNANKIQIKQAIAKTYGVTVVDVSTNTLPGKNKSRMTRKGVARGITNATKKAIVTLAKGETIDFYANI